MDQDQSQAVSELGEAIRHCIRSLGPNCTARIIGQVAIDLLADRRLGTGEPDPVLPGRHRRASRRPPR